MRRLALIPARAGSKRIPGKNTRVFAGRPIIEYSLEAALAAQSVDEVAVTTDDDAVAEIARAFGAGVIERPAHLASDTATLLDVVLHALEVSTPRPESVCLMLATAPFLTASRIDEAHSVMQAAAADGAMTMAQFEAPIWRAFSQTDDGAVEMIWPEHMFTRSQDLPEALFDAGQLYWLKSAAVLAERKVYLNRMAALTLPRHLVQDIDTEEDWQRAEMLFEVWQRNNSDV